ncbi:MAG: sodium-translocating pyrophosphatase [Planctomycetes bacterium]|nr:sodium-translocating pyrophosphatase [Planctomycetota bacterium]
MDPITGTITSAVTNVVTNPIPLGWWIAPIGALIALLFAYIFYKGMKKQDPGEPDMVRIAGYVKVGAMAYLKQQYKIVGIFFVVLVILLSLMAFVFKTQSAWVPFAFLSGGFFSGLCGFLGMKTATEASSRTAFAAKTSLNKGLVVAFRSGAVMGLIVVGFGLIDISAWFYVLYKWVGMDLQHVTITMLCFGMGASTQALFARVGGGIFTKAADVGADLVGKVEANIPEDDPRNPAVIADNVGDNVGDVAGMGADLYESYCGSILAAAALGAAAALSLGIKEIDKVIMWIVLPMIIAGVGNIFSVIGVYAVRTGEKASQKELMKALFRGINLTSYATIVVAGLVMYLLLPQNWLGLWASMVCGLLAGLVIGKATEYYTSSDYKPTQEIGNQALTGPATVVIAGMSVGMISTVIPVVTVCLGTILAYGLSGGFSDPILGLYGISLAAVGMLSNLGITLATDAYGPIADNAGGNAQMTNQPAFVRERTDALDSLGNTTAATGKGFAIGSAALTALALVAAYIEEIRMALVRAGTALGSVLPSDASITYFMEYYKVHLMNPVVLVGIFLGAMLTFAFVAMTLRAVGRAAGQMVVEVRRQFKEIPGLLEGKKDAQADYSSCVAIATKGAQHEMILPSAMALAAPILVGLVLGVPGVIGMLTGAIACGFVMAVFLANSGGAWDNAKKWIEGGQHGGKGSYAHKAGVVGDTVGDPFKDTSGPSLNILIKLMSMVAIVFAGVTVKYSPIIAQWLGIGGK